MLRKVRFNKIQNCFQPEVGKPVLTGFLVKLSLESRSEVVQVTGARFVAFGRAGLSVVTGPDMSITVQVGLSVKEQHIRVVSIDGKGVCRLLLDPALHCRRLHIE